MNLERRLVCGCGPKDPGDCSLGDLLFRFREWRKLHAHWREMVERTFFGAGPRKTVNVGAYAPRGRS